MNAPFFMPRPRAIRPNEFSVPYPFPPRPCEVSPDARRAVTGWQNAPLFHAATTRSPSERNLHSISVPPCPCEVSPDARRAVTGWQNAPLFSCRDHAHRQPRTIRPNEVSMISTFTRAHAKSVRMRGAPSHDSKTPRFFMPRPRAQTAAHNPSERSLHDIRSPHAHTKSIRLRGAPSQDGTTPRFFMP